MKRMLRLSIGLVLASFGIATVASAQSPGVPRNTKKPPTTATPNMIDEAIQRSEARARAARQRQIDKNNQQRGSEEPFRFTPNQR